MKLTLITDEGLEFTTSWEKSKEHELNQLRMGTQMLAGAMGYGTSTIIDYLGED